MIFLKTFVVLNLHKQSHCKPLCAKRAKIKGHYKKYVSVLQRGLEHIFVYRKASIM